MLGGVIFTRCFFILLAFCLLAPNSNVVLAATAAIQDTPTPAVEAEMAVDEEDEGEADDYDEKLIDFHNPWRFDEQALKVAELFWFEKAFLVEARRVQMVCELDKKQASKLKFASKRAAKIELDVWMKKWKQQIDGFPGL